MRSGKELRAVHDLQHPGLVGAVGEVDAVPLDAGRNRAVQVGGRFAGGTGLLADQAEVADQHRVRRVGQVEHLGHGVKRVLHDIRDGAREKISVHHDHRKRRRQVGADDDAPVEAGDVRIEHCRQQLGQRGGCRMRGGR